MMRERINPSFCIGSHCDGSQNPRPEHPTIFPQHPQHRLGPGGCQGEVVGRYGGSVRAKLRELIGGDCQLVHSGRAYGENLFWGSSSAFTGIYAVNAWVGEAQYNNYTSNTCVARHVCGHYTQVEWRNSVQLGCARVVEGLSSVATTIRPGTISLKPSPSGMFFAMVALMAVPCEAECVVWKIKGWKEKACVDHISELGRRFQELSHGLIQVESKGAETPHSTDLLKRRTIEIMKEVEEDLRKSSQNCQDDNVQDEVDSISNVEVAKGFKRRGKNTVGGKPQKRWIGVLEKSSRGQSSQTQRASHNSIESHQPFAPMDSVFVFF
ncbi:hypothetical protein QJS10_CPB21g00135 [Acorus calamus]|uniref:SCP domain-containing protein n=1 Tax=Acorus calamus TaxID=4465 RepID=A0AAV9C600_ACOCL|nr:hypothetical protein QJS10_CPB21g00135 [Acorus calamus]